MGLSQAALKTRHNFYGRVSESSRVSARGCVPAASPFCCNRYARISSDCCVVKVLPAYSAMGPLISPHTVKSFAPPNFCFQVTPVSAGPIPPSSLAPWQPEHEFSKSIPPAAACSTEYQPFNLEGGCSYTWPMFAWHSRQL